MRWQISKVVTPRPADSSIEKLGVVLLLLVLSPLLLVLAAVLLMLMAVAGLYHALHNWLGKPAPEPVPRPAPPVCVLDKPTLRIELMDDDADWSPELQQLYENWDGTGDENWLSLATTTPELPGVHGRLVTAFSYPWHGGLLLQVVEAAAGEAAVTSWLGWADPATHTWQRLVEVGEFGLYHSPEAPANVIEGWNQRVGKIRLELQAAPVGPVSAREQ